MFRLDSKQICDIVDESFSSAFKAWSRQIESELYPAAFANEYSWLCVKNSLKINNDILKEALKQSLSKLLAD